MLCAIRQSGSEFSTLLKWHLVLMQTDGLISSIHTSFFPFLPNTQPDTGLTGPCCLPSACHVWHQSMYFLFEISPVGHTIDYSLTLLSRRQLISPSNRSVQHLIHISVMYSYLFSKSVLAYQMAKENIPCCYSLVSFCSCHKMILFHAELTLGLHVMQEKLFESRLSSC